MVFRIRLGRALSLAVAAALSAASLFAHAPHLAFSSQYLNFVAVPGGASPPPQTLVMTNTTHGFMPWSAAVAVTGGGTWLTVSPAQGALPGLVFGESTNITVSVASPKLAAGVYYGIITISAPGSTTPFSPPADNTPQVIEVALTVRTTGQAAPGIGLLYTPLAFAGPAGLGRSYSAPVDIGNLGGGTLTWTLGTETTDGASWLSASATSDNRFLVTATVGSLGKGSYTGNVIVMAQGAANSPKKIPVLLEVRDPLPALFGVSSASLSFSGTSGEENPATQTLTISNQGDLDLNWKADVTTFNGGPWLTVTPTSGINGVRAQVTASVASVSEGTYAGRITLTADGAGNSPLVVAVTLAVKPPEPIFDERGVVNAASYQRGSLAPGEIISIFGSRLGPKEPAVLLLDPGSQNLPTTLGGTKVTFNGVPAPLFYVSDSQVNLQVPYEVLNQSSVTMTVSPAGLSPVSIDLPITDTAPGVFTVDGIHAAALNEDSTLNTASNPAARGSVIQLFLTGQGYVVPAAVTGALAPSTPPFPAPVAQVGINIGNVQTKADFVGLAPGFVGLTQINARIPMAVAPSDHVSLVVGMAFNQSAPVMIAVK